LAPVQIGEETADFLSRNRRVAAVTKVWAPFALPAKMLLVLAATDAAGIENASSNHENA
jgi:hypothetical protein